MNIKLDEREYSFKDKVKEQKDVDMDVCILDLHSRIGAISPLNGVFTFFECTWV